MSRSVLDLIRDDPGYFAAKVLGAPLWDYQLDFVRSRARTRCANSGRQVGKSRMVAVEALHTAISQSDRLVLILSAGEVASRRLLEECVNLAARAPMLRGSLQDDSKSVMTFTNGSRIVSIPASERQARGWSADLLVVDEAAFVSESVWEAVEPVTAARPGSRVILASTPFSTDHFFYRLWSRGMSSDDREAYESFHWPSSKSPLISEAWLEEKQRTTNALTFEREYLARFTDSLSALLSPEEIERATADYDLIEPEMVDRDHGYFYRHRTLSWSDRRWTVPAVAGGLDYGKQQDASALVLLGVVDDGGRNVGEQTMAHAGDYVYFVPWLEQHFRMDYGAFIDRVIEVCGGYHVRTLVSELNGVGAYPTEELKNRLARAYADGKAQRWQGQHATYVSGVWTDARRKQAIYGRLKGFLQSGKLVLPRHPELLQQLASLEVTLTAAGNTRIEVPEARGHDDLADALGQVLASIGNPGRDPRQEYQSVRSGREPEFVELRSGLLFPRIPRLLDPSAPQALVLGSYGEESRMPW